MEKYISLAKILSEIHSHTLYPFYSRKPSAFWEELEDISSDKNEVDKQFFIKMAREILNKIFLRDKDD